jgi:hypothetical protein
MILESAATMMIECKSLKLTQVDNGTLLVHAFVDHNALDLFLGSALGIKARMILDLFNYHKNLQLTPIRLRKFSRIGQDYELHPYLQASDLYVTETQKIIDQV